MGVVFWSALLVSYVTVPALHGWRSGLGNLITRVEQAGAFLSQLAVVAGAALAFWLLITVLSESQLGIGFRIGVAPLVAALMTTIAASVAGPLAPLLSLGLSLLAAFVAIASSWPTILRPHARGLGLCLGLVGTASAFGAAARLLALRASSDALTALFSAARVMATVALVCCALAWLLGSLWLARGRVTRLALMLAVPATVGLASAFAVLRSSADPASPVSVLVTRMVTELGRHPQPLVADFGRHALDAGLVVAALLALLTPGRPLYGRAAVCYLLLPRGATDIPLLALALIIAALSGTLHAVRGAPAPVGADGSRN